MTMTKANPDCEERRRRQKEIADQLKASGALDEIFAKIDAGEALTGEQGLISGILKAALERGLEAELTEHVGYERGAVEASLHENSRTGMSPRPSRPRSVTWSWRSRETGTARSRRCWCPRVSGAWTGDDMIISLYAGGMTLRDIQHHLASTIGTEISHETISKIVDQIGEEILIWQQRPLEALYPVIFLDAIVVKVRDSGHVRNKAAHLAIGIDMEGIACAGHLGAGERGCEVLGGRLRRARQPRRAGRSDRLLRRSDRLPRSGRRQAWPEATVQTCVVHLIRAAMRFVSHPRPQGRRRRAEADLSGRERRDSACRARRLRGDRAGQALPLDQQGIP